MDEHKLSWTEKISVFFKRPLAAKAKARMSEQKELIKESELSAKARMSEQKTVIREAETVIAQNSKEEIHQSEINANEVTPTTVVQSEGAPAKVIQAEINPTKVVQTKVVQVNEVKPHVLITEKGRGGEKGFSSWKAVLQNPLTLLKTKKKSLLTSPYISASYDMGQEYRVIAYNSRLISICFISSLFVITGLSLSLFCLFPLKEIRPYLIGLRDKGDQVVHIEPAYKTAQSINKVAEGLCRHYVTLREEINCVDEKLRWGGELYYFCSEEIWNDFTTHMNPMLPTSPVRQCQERKATRSVKILLSTHLKENIYRVEWELTTTIRGQIAEKSHWVSLLEVEMRPITTKQTEENVNPLGFTVTKYTVKPWEGRGEKAA